MLHKGGNYQFPTKNELQPAVNSEENNKSSIIPARIYYKIITPTQAIYYDGNKFPYLKGKFLVASYAEGSIYALSFNDTGSIVQEIAIRLPEIDHPVISIAQGPSGDIYIGGEKIYKLMSIDRDTIRPLTYFINEVSRDVQVKGLSINLTNKSLYL